MIKFERTPTKGVIDIEASAEQRRVVRKKAIQSGYKHGWIMFGDRLLFVRSQWDANMCAYYEWLKNKGHIKNWYYEPITFWFDKIKRGTNNYKPDFKIEEDELVEYYVEVKGFWTQKDTVKAKRMKKYHPLVNMTYVKAEDYKKIEKQSGHLIPGWNQPFLKREEIEHLLPTKQKKKVKNSIDEAQ